MMAHTRVLFRIVHAALRKMWRLSGMAIVPVVHDEEDARGVHMDLRRWKSVDLWHCDSTIVLEGNGRSKVI